MGVASRYYIRLKNQQGKQVAVFDNFAYVEISKKLNDVGSYALRFDSDDDDRYSLFELDGQLEFYRAVLNQSTVRSEWRKEWEAFHRKQRRVTDANGARHFESIGVGYNDLIARSIVAYKEGTIRADKNAFAETVMKEYVEENCGPTADETVVGRLYQGGFPNFIVESTTGAGVLWTGGRAYENVLDVIKDIASMSGIDFAVIGNGDAQFLFKAFTGQMGEDRTTNELNPTNGMNGAGNAPVIFSIEHGSMQEMEYELDRTSEANVVVVMGKGDGSTRTTVTRSREAAIADSPWNRREISRAAASYDDDLETYSLNTFGDEVLEENKAKETFSFVPMQSDALVYGLDYGLGDRVTAIYRGVSFHKKIVGVKITISPGDGEVVELEFANVPSITT
jgi:hypothetical protein